MKVLLIHQAFASGDETGGTRHWELARFLQDHGDHMSIVASQVSYLTGARRNVERFKFVDSSNEGGVPVARVYGMHFRRRGVAQRVLAFMLFALASIGVALRLENPDLVMGTTPPIFQAVSAWVVAAVRRKPYLLEVRDLWPEFLIDMGVLRHPILIWAARRLENFLYRRADHLLVNSPAYRDYLIAKAVPPSKISFIPNGIDPSMFRVAASEGTRIRERYNLDDKFVVMYAGAHGMANDLDTILEAAAILHNHDDIHFVFVGDGPERRSLQEVAAQSGLGNVTFIGPVPKSSMPEMLAAASVCVATLMNIPMFATTYPNKVFDYMAAQRPTILAINGVIRDVIDRSNGGVYVSPGNAQELANAVLTLSRDSDTCRVMGESARAYVEVHFNREWQAGEFHELLKRLVIHALGYAVR